MVTTWGADVYIDATAGVAALCKEASRGENAKAVIVTAGKGKAYQAAFDIVVAFGTVVCVRIPPPDQRMELHSLHFTDKGITLVGTLVRTRTDKLEALAFVRRGVVKPAVKTISLDDLLAIAADVGKVRQIAFSQ